MTNQNEFNGLVADIFQAIDNSKESEEYGETWEEKSEKSMERVDEALNNGELIW